MTWEPRARAPLDDKKLERIRRCYEEYSPSSATAHRAFFSDAHANIGLLLDEVDRLRALIAREESG